MMDRLPIRPVAALTVALAVALAGCSATSNKRALLEALQEYNDGVRWHRTDEVANFIHDGTRRAAYFAQTDSRSDVKVTDTRIRGVKLARDGKAIAMVSIDWYSLRTVRAHRTLMRQTWDRKDGNWRLTDQRWVRGATFPLFATVTPRNLTRGNSTPGNLTSRRQVP